MKVLVLRGFVIGPGKVAEVGKMVNLPKKVAEMAISAGKAKLPPEANRAKPPAPNQRVNR